MSRSSAVTQSGLDVGMAYLIRITLALTAALVVTAPPAQAGAAGSQSHDGAHDFDFDLGMWRTEIVRHVHPFDGSDETLRMHGTVAVRPLWHGKAQVEEIEADGAGGHWQGMTVFLYDPAAHQWSMNFANSSVGRFTIPMVGSFQNGRGELIGSDTFEGRAINVRAAWSHIATASHTYEESYSDNGGRTWHVAFTAHKTKASSEPSD